MKILVVGRGWVGQKIFNELHSRMHEVVITSHEFAHSIIQHNKYDWIINCAGVTGVPNVDACENNKQLTYEGNALFPIELSHVCNTLGIRFAHFSSGCIYEGDITDVRAKPNFFGSTYSISKGISDTYLLDTAQVYRIRMPFTGVNENKNTLSKILYYAKHGKLFEAGYNSLTDLDEAVRVAANLIERGADNGPYNLVNSGAVTMHDVVELLGITPEWFTPEEFIAATVAKRSTCTIPAYEEMRPIQTALQIAIDSLLDKK